MINHVVLCMLMVLLKLRCRAMHADGVVKVKIIAIYLCIHGKCNPWCYVTMTRDVRLFKV